MSGRSPLPHLNPTARALLIALQEASGLGPAARRLGVSQPAASKALLRAEAQCGVALVRRDRRPLRLTREGEVLAEYARRVARLDEDLARDLDAIRRKGSGVVRIASFGASASSRVLPPLLKEARRSLPELSVRIIEMQDGETLEALRQGRVDFAVTVLHPDRDVDADLDAKMLVEDQLVAVLAETDPALRAAGGVTARALAARPFIMSKVGSEPLIREWFAAAGSAPNVQHETQQMTSVLALVRAGLGVSILAETAAPELHPGVAYAPLDPPYPRSIGLARMGRAFASHGAERFWALAGRSSPIR